MKVSTNFFVYYYVLPKIMGENVLEMLIELSNKIWEKERIPKDWEVGIIITIFKKRY